MNRRWFLRLVGLSAGLGSLTSLGVGGSWYAGRRADERRLNETLARLDADDSDWHVVGVVKAHNAAIPDDDAANVTKVTLSALGWRPPSGKARQDAINAKEIPDLAWDDDRLPHDDAFCSLYEVHLESGQAHLEAFAARKLPTGGRAFHFGEPDPFGTLFPELFRVRECCVLFRDYATVEAYFSRGDEGLRAAEASLHFTQASLATEPTLIAQLVRNAGCALAVGSAQQSLAWAEPAAGLAELQAAFAQAATVDGLTPAARGERAATMRTFDNVRSGALPSDYFETLDDFGGGGAAQSGWDRWRRRWNAPNRVRQAEALLRLHNGLVAAMKLQGPDRRAACQAALDSATPEVAALTPSVSKCVEADDRCKAQLLCASVGLACERHRRRFGRFPASLADIPASILPSIPADPFNGFSLGYRVLADGACAYSVGPDGLHRGTPDETVSVRDSQIFSFRLWNPEARRRPPLPRPVQEPDDLLDTLGEP